ncbi:MAG: transcriptional repressor, partial [Chloroflexi bacterium]
MATRRAQHLAKRITARGRRLTDQRLIVAEALAAGREAVSAQELYARLRGRHPRLALATVYRALEAQVESGMARRLERAGHVSSYIACDPEHHHHLV